jgi:hypothetical protein
MTTRANKRWLTIGGLIALFCSFVVAQQSTGLGAAPLKSIIDGMEKAQTGVRPQISYVVIREYRLSSANNSGANSDVVAEVDFRPPATKDYKIQKSSGSIRGQQVVRRILDHEVETASNSSNTRAALDGDNYDFTYLGEAILDGQACYLLGLKPKRKDRDLIYGQAWVDKSSFFVRRIEGDMAKTPSWWLKRIHVSLTFADVKGTWLQTNMEAVADVRVAGPHTLTSRILDYRTPDVVASAWTGLHPTTSLTVSPRAK